MLYHCAHSAGNNQHEFDRKVNVGYCGCMHCWYFCDRNSLIEALALTFDLSQYYITMIHYTVIQTSGRPIVPGLELLSPHTCKTVAPNFFAKITLQNRLFRLPKIWRWHFSFKFVEKLIKVKIDTHLHWNRILVKYVSAFVKIYIILLTVFLVNR